MRCDKVSWQGDVGLKPVRRIPEGAKKKEGMTVALGEATGHHHTFQEAVQLWEHEGKTYVQPLQDEVVLEHQEHKPITVKKQVYEVVRQRVFDVQQGIRQVMD